MPKGCPVNVTDNRIAEIYKELRTLKLEEGPSPAPNAIAVLLRVFLEMSVDHFLENNGGSLTATDNGRVRWKKLDKKLKEVVAMLVSMGVTDARDQTDGSETRRIIIRPGPREHPIDRPRNSRAART